jgi:hypothetical protein
MKKQNRPLTLSLNFLASRVFLSFYRVFLLFNIFFYIFENTKLPLNLNYNNQNTIVKIQKHPFTLGLIFMLSSVF